MLYRVLILLSDWQIRPTAVSDLSSQRLTDLSTSKDLAASDTDFASMPLSIFTSKPVSLSAKQCRPTLAAWLLSCLAAKSAPRTTSRAPSHVPPPREALPIIYT